MSFIDLPLNKKGRTSGIETKIESNNHKNIKELMGDVALEYVGSPDYPVLGRQMVSKNGFVSTVHKAFADEIPLVLSPDQLWTVILQGVSEHVNRNPNQFHKTFVYHAAGTKKVILIREDALVKNGRDSPWHLVFPKFEEKMGENIVGGSSSMLPQFSTMSATTRISHVIATMDVLKSYFSYEVCTMCGIPRITLLGSSDDWRLLYQCAKDLLARVSLHAWWQKLSIILQQCIDLVTGVKKDKQFWAGMYLYSAGESGQSDSVSGWIKYLFPYLKPEGCKESILNRFDDDYLTIDAFPCSINVVPFEWKYYNEQISMNFLAGIIGVGQYSDGKSVTPAHGWAVSYQNKSDNPDGELYVNGSMIVKSVEDFEKIAEKRPQSFIFQSTSALARSFMVNIMTLTAEENDKEFERIYGKNMMDAAKMIRITYNLVTQDWKKCTEIVFERNY